MDLREALTVWLDDSDPRWWQAEERLRTELAELASSSTFQVDSQVLDGLIGELLDDLDDLPGPGAERSWLSQILNNRLRDRSRGGTPAPVEPVGPPLDLDDVKRVRELLELALIPAVQAAPIGMSPAAFTQGLAELRQYAAGGTPPTQGLDTQARNALYARTKRTREALLLTLDAWRDEAQSERRRLLDGVAVLIDAELKRNRRRRG